MEINKKNRTELKNYFLANKIPTQKDFAEFIDANLNQAEDGIVKTQGNPVALQAEGDAGGPQEALHLFGSFSDPNPSWGMNLNPRVDPEVAESNQPGLNIKDASGASRLFIKAGSGEVGVGTIEPSAQLSVQSQGDGPLLTAISTRSGDANLFEVAQEANDGVLSIRNGSGKIVSRLSGTETRPSFLLSRVGVGTDQPETHLHVKGPGSEIRISNTQAGTPPRLSLYHENGKFWNLSSRGSELEFSPSGNDANSFGITEGGGLRIRGVGREHTPDGHLHLSNGTIMLGGNNGTGQNRHSASISAGNHARNSLNIVGMSNGTDSRSRKVDIWAEGGMTVRGHIKIPSAFVVAFSVALTSSSLKGNRNPLSFGQINYNVGGHWKGTTAFIAPVAGVYLFSMHMRNNTGDDVAWALRLNNTGYVNGASGNEKNERTYVRARLDNHSASRTVITVLKAGDRVHVQQFGGGNDNYSSGFEGVLLVALP
ncbi:MAG: hypothetical protein AAGN35_16110 [Bacteroidota bacterium]